LHFWLFHPDTQRPAHAGAGRYSALHTRT
jgi:hypothetical protein